MRTSQYMPSRISNDFSRTGATGGGVVSIGGTNGSLSTRATDGSGVDSTTVLGCGSGSGSGSSGFEKTGAGGGGGGTGAHGIMGGNGGGLAGSGLVTGGSTFSRSGGALGDASGFGVSFARRASS